MTEQLGYFSTELYDNSELYNSIQGRSCTSFNIEQLWETTNFNTMEFIINDEQHDL